MKQLIILIAFSLLLGCNDDVPKPNKDCNCGTVANDGVDYTNGYWCYWLEIRNNCSGNKQTFCFDQDVWLNAPVGEKFCVYDVDSW